MNICNRTRGVFMMCMDRFSDSVTLLHALCCKLVNLQESVSAYICTCVQCKIHLGLLLLYYFQNFDLSLFFQTCALLCDFGPTPVQ